MFDLIISLINCAVPAKFKVFVPGVAASLLVSRPCSQVVQQSDLQSGHIPIVLQVQ
jgi:hypothetical protein